MLVRIIGGHGGVSPGFRATSYLIDAKLLLDAGSVAAWIQISAQCLIDNILISHPHLDHIKDLAFMCDNCFGLRHKPFDVYTNVEVQNAIKDHLMNDIIWPDFTKLPTPQSPTMRFHTIECEKELILGDYKIVPVAVNHYGHAMGFIIEKGDSAVVFTQDTGPTDRIWEIAKTYKNLKAIFTEVSFPNKLQNVADASKHHSPATMEQEIKKMPADVPIFLGHLKPHYQDELFLEIDEIGNSRLAILGSDDTTYSL